MKEAIKEAEIAKEKSEIPIGCVIVKNSEIIGRGHNEKEAYKNSIYHAEIIALSKACKTLEHWWLEDCDVYVTLEPCAMCAGAMLNARIRNLYVGARDLRMGAVGTSIDLSNIENFNHSFKVEFGILEDECRDILSEFFKNLRKKKKEI